MKNFSSIVLALIFLVNLTVNDSKAQSLDPYNYNWKIDVPITIAGTALTGYGFYLIGQKSGRDSATVANLNREDIIKFNRSAINPYNEDIGNISDIFFYGSYPYPLLLLFDKDIRQDALKYIGLYLETMSIVGTGYAMTAGLVDKYRPYVYHPETSIAKKKGSGSLNSFPGGHPSATAGATFFAAKVYSDYHPDSGFKYVLYGIAAGSTLANAYLRYKGGYHFPTDLMIGVTFGTAVGLLVPTLHKKSGSDISLVPLGGDYKGLGMIYRF